MSLGLGLSRLYPEGSLKDHYRVEDHLDGQGPFISHFNEAKLGPRPTEDVILQAAKEAEDEETDKKTERTGMQNKIKTLKAGNATPEQVQKVLAYVLERLT